MRVAIIGGGLMGLALAYRLCLRGCAVEVFERQEQLGGLATWHDFGRFHWDRFYHVILPSDRYLIGLLRDIGLDSALKWQRTQTGFYVDGQSYPLSNNLDFLRFPLLSLWDKMRLAMTILYCSRIDDWRKLEKFSVEDWLLRYSGRGTYEKMWRPLLLAKLGENYRRVSAVFIWSYIKRMFSARDASAGREQLGHVQGGYRTVFERLVTLIEQHGGKIHTNTAVEHIGANPRAGLDIDCGARVRFDKVIFTSPVNVLRRVAGEGLVQMNAEGHDVEYLGVVCPVLVSREPLTPYYIVNIADARIPFTGVIGMSNIVDLAETAGLHITYLPRYVLSDDPLLGQADSEIERTFLAGVRTMFPDFDTATIESMHINRATVVQPLQVLNYSRLVPRCETKHPDLFVVNTAQFLNNTLNNNEVIRNVETFFERYGAEFAVAQAPGATQ